MSDFPLAHHRRRDERPGHWSLAPILVAGPVDADGNAVYPVTLADVKAQLKVETTDDDGVISGLIAAVTDKRDGWTGTLGRCLVTQTWRATYDRFWRAPVGLRLPLLPVQSIAAITYYDENGAVQTLSAARYSLLANASGYFVQPAYGASWPDVQHRVDAVTVDFVAGYGDASAVPARIKQAITMEVMRLYDNGPDAAGVDAAIAALLSGFGPKI